MQEKLKGFLCGEYLQEYYSLGLFHATECEELYSHQNMIYDQEKDFLRIGEVFDDHDLTFGFRRNQEGIWGHYNRHYDGKFQFVSNSLKELCEGWYQRNSEYWNSMDSKKQWKEIRNFLKINIENYSWEGEPVLKFIDFCINNEKLTNYFIKAYKTMVGITLKNGFSSRSFTNMVYVEYGQELGKYLVYYKTDFFDYDAKSKDYSFNEIETAIDEIDNWIKTNV